MKSRFRLKPLLGSAGCALLLLIAGVQTGQAQEMAKATFAAGCFWCTEADFDKVEGVVETVSGYANGHVENPTYEQVSAGGTGSYEAVQVTYDPEKVSYKDLLEFYWPNSDPLDAGGQFCDRGASYRPAIFFQNPTQHELAEASKQRVAKQFDMEGDIVTSITELTSFYPAEDYHQNYYKKNPVRYKFYRWNCGRDARLEELWGERNRLDIFE